MTSFIAARSLLLSEDLKPKGEPHERRRHRRVPVGLPCRFELPRAGERRGELIDLSVRGAGVAAAPGAVIGDRVTLRIGDVGQIAGEVIRVDGRGFGLMLSGGKAARIARADQLMVLLQGGSAAGRAVRFPQGRETVLERFNGEVAYCTILDVSETGASIACSLLPALGERVRIGRKRAEVVRYHSDGFGVAFTPPNGAKGS
ncbi:MAG: PilZ domain-containing protein [Parvularcula sp.]|nr:PilZ domain-containing protein [Parvularcula sp.]